MFWRAYERKEKGGKGEREEMGKGMMGDERELCEYFGFVTAMMREKSV